ncbi:type IV pilin protein [Oceanicoccus sp. KOV_DT_Chl]|uniref:type IV pilin protein n=1 Tax=Oceanicoccus sp. KOV_DT_Chl TaxID=1904639 RepID=UPI000C7B793E|nr:type IV pilin protein [Oceanicoccus sp. KOV_DT_Chl]
MPQNDKQKGFTLVELMVVVAILGILFSIAIPRYQTYTIRANRQDAFSMLTMLRFAQEEYKADNGTYVTDLQLLGYSSATPESPDGLYTVEADLCASGTITQCVNLIATPVSTKSQAKDDDGTGNNGVITLNTRSTKTGGWK